MTLIEPAAPVARKRRLSYALVLTPLLIGNALMLALCLLGFYVLSATRAYVGGESQWSKARAQAVNHLRAYAASGAPAQLQRFQQALQVPLGDRAARLELDKPVPDLRLATAAFERGGNAAEDIPGMIRLYRWAGHSDLMRPSVQAWERGDTHIFRLQTMGEQLQQLHAQPGPTGEERLARIAVLMFAIEELDNELLGLERQFSQALGEASRSTYLALALAIGLTALLLTLTAYALARSGLRRQARYEAALEEANQRWSLAAQSDGLGLFEWQQHSDRVLLDARACAVYGLACGPQGLNLARSQLHAQVDPEDIPALELQLDQTLASATRAFRHHFRIRVHGRAGMLRHVEVSGLMLGGAGRNEPRMVGVIKDVSARLHQAQLELEIAAAERSAAARMEFLSRLSHELRTPLNAVLGFSELMLLDQADALSPNQQRRVQLIGGAGRHLLRLVDDVLDISSIDSGHFSVELQPTPLAPVLASAAALVASEVQANGIQLALEPPPASLSVLADEQRLGQVLANLLSNACKYNRHGGLVRVRTELQGGGVQIAIEDQGRGLDEAEQAQLFQPFKRLPATAHLSGTGLGLSIVKLLMEQMGGTVSVSSQPGTGSVFTLTLRAA
ncbi:ATP-binding protein [Paucibacter sp. PLA-PC-4]|uniref:sensor histidine kinase n=1 Tax=Paucibacter sp. PLA-PC-4 TaxID=2993655 RepID=UPI0022493516|nr:sensor histidine kinase [Paucibacter sp. PLA-PC-4]MCX2860286.1 ATP-binding protein [Paucibacter sp. PLA-PC-4]